MSDVMLHGVLRMPPNLWRDDPIDVAQRHSRYVEASDRIRELEAAAAERDALIHDLQGYMKLANEQVAELETLRAELAAIKATEPVIVGGIRYFDRDDGDYGVMTFTTEKGDRVHVAIDKKTISWMVLANDKAGTLLSASAEHPLYTHPHVTLTEEQVRADYRKWAGAADTLYGERAWLACAKRYDIIGGGT